MKSLRILQNILAGFIGLLVGFFIVLFLDLSVGLSPFDTSNFDTVSWIITVGYFGLCSFSGVALHQETINS